MDPETEKKDQAPQAAPGTTPLITAANLPEREALRVWVACLSLEESLKYLAHRQPGISLVETCKELARIARTYSWEWLCCEHTDELDEAVSRAIQVGAWYMTQYNYAGKSYAQKDTYLPVILDLIGTALESAILSDDEPYEKPRVAFETATVILPGLRAHEERLLMVPLLYDMRWHAKNDPVRTGADWYVKQLNAATQDSGHRTHVLSKHDERVIGLPLEERQEFVRRLIIELQANADSASHEHLLLKELRSQLRPQW